MLGFYQHRPSQNLACFGNRHLNPKWIFGLEFAPDVTQALPQNVDSPGQTFVDYASILANVIQTTAPPVGSYWKARDNDGYGWTFDHLVDAGLQGSILQLNGAHVQPTTGISMSVWFNLDVFTANAVILGRGVIGGGYVFSTGAGGTLGAQVDNGASTFLLFPGGGFRAGVWYHLGQTWDGAVWNIYLNGAIVNSQALVGAFGIANNSKWRALGQWDDFGTPPQGKCRYPMVWRNRILTPADMYELATAPSPFNEGIRNTDIHNIMFALPAAPTPPTPVASAISVSDFLNRRVDPFLFSTAVAPGVTGPTRLFSTDLIQNRTGSHRTFIAYFLVSGGGPAYAGATLSFGSSPNYVDWSPAFDLSTLPVGGGVIYVPQTAYLYNDLTPIFVNPAGSPGPYAPLTITAYGWWI